MERTFPNQPTRVLIELYLLRMQLLQTTRMYQQAVVCAQEGLEIARVNQDPLGTFKLWSALGDVYQAGQNWMEAELCLRIGSSLDPPMDHQEYLLHLYNRLGASVSSAKKMEISRRDHGPGDSPGRVRSGNPIDVGNTHLGRRPLSSNRGSRKSDSTFQTSLGIIKKHPHRKKEMEILFKLAQCHEKKDPPSFLRYMENMYHVQQEINPEPDNSTGLPQPFNRFCHYSPQNPLKNQKTPETPVSWYLNLS